MEFNLDTRQIVADDYTKQAYIEFGAYSNLNRHLPYLLDGLKPVYRKTIISAYMLKERGLVKSARIVGECIGKYSPHGDKSVVPVVSELVNLGLFDGQGNHGGMNIDGSQLPPAAPRYTEARLTDNIRDSIDSFIDVIPHSTNELGNDEPDYIPTPLPYALIKGDLGIGIGTGCRIPALDPRSLIKAYRADDPTLLESAYGLQLVKERSSLKSLWEFGTGRITRKFKTQWIDGGISIEGDATIAVPDLGYMYQQQDWQNVEIIDASKEVGKLLIRKLPRVKNITEDEIRKFVEMASYVRESYYMRTFYGKTAAPIGIRDWIDICYRNYCRLINMYRDKNIKKYERNILIYKNFKQVADKILKTEDSYDKIASDLGIEKFIVDEVGKKAINTLRNLDPNKEIKKAEDKIAEFKSINETSMIDKYVSVLK